MLKPTTPPQTPMARARSRGSVNVFVMIDIATGFSIDPPIAWTVRNATSQPSDGATLQLADASPSGGGFDVVDPSGGARYEVRPDRLTIVSNGRVENSPQPPRRVGRGARPVGQVLRIPIFALSIATSITSFAAQMLAFVTLPFLLQTLLGRGIVESGLLMTPWPLAVGCAAPFAGRLADPDPTS